MELTERRSPLLTVFATIANLYLFVFAASAFVAIADEIWSMTAGHSPLGVLHRELATLVLLSSLTMACVVALVPHLPKSVFLPLILAAAWLAFGGPPFGSLAKSGDGAGLFLALCQATLAMTAFLIIHLRTGQPFLSAATMPHLQNVFLRIAFAATVTLVVGLSGLVAIGIASAVSLAEEETNGYLQFTWNDVKARVTLMRRGETQVLLVATAHIAERRFYEDLYASIPEQAVVLAEGVTDDKGLLGTDMSQRDKVADTLGLDSQASFEELLASGGTAKPGRPVPAPRKTQPIVVRADVDVSELSPATINCLRADFAAATDKGAVLDAQGPLPRCSEHDLEIFWDEILRKRNAKLLSEFDRLSAKYQTFVVPWGAMHMPELEKAFLQRGFRIEASHFLTLAHYDTVAGHVFGGLAAFRVLGPGNRPYQMQTSHWPGR